MHNELNTLKVNTDHHCHHVLRSVLHAAMLWWLFHAGLSWAGLAIFLAHYVVGIFSITVAYHRYFSHKTFKTSRFTQLIMAAIGCAQMQGGPLTWSAIHRHHHSTSDTPEDLHSPIRGFYESHYGWLMNPKTYEIGFGTPLKDLAKFKELVWLDRYSFVPILGYFAALWLSGHLYAMFNSASDIDGLFVLMWGGVVRVVVVWHVAWSVNSVCHIWGSRPFKTQEDSRNNFWVAMLSLGEGWHNNHHKFPFAARNGFGWKQPDISYCFIWFMSKLGIFWDVNAVSIERLKAVELVKEATAMPEHVTRTPL